MPQPQLRGRKRKLQPAILSAAVKLFAQRGVEQPTMDEVAEAAGVRRPRFIRTSADGPHWSTPL